MRICVIGPSFPYKGGIAHYNNWLCNFLSKKHELECISFRRLYPKIIYPGKDQRDDSAKDRTRFKTLEILDTVNPLTWRAAFKRIKEFDPDIVLFYWWTPYFTILNKYLTSRIKSSLDSRVIYLCHNVLPHEGSFVDKTLSRIALKDADNFIVHALKEKNDLKGLIPGLKKNQVAVRLHPSYDVQFKFKNPSRKEARKKLHLSGNIMLFFGYVREYKGLIYLIEALPEVLKKVDVKLMVVGEFWKDKERYTDRIEELGIKKKVILIDKYTPDDKVEYYYSAADVVVLPYLSATNSGIAQIAFGFDKPVITTAVGGLPEVVTHGKTGLVVPPKDLKKLAEAIVRYFKKGLERKFVKNILEERERFSWDRMVETIEGFR